MQTEYKEVKTKLDGKALFYGEYRGNSIGRALHYLSEICPNLRDNAEFGWPNGLVKVYGEDLAVIDWSKGYPEFKFLGQYEYLNDRQKQLLDGEI